MNRGYLVLFLGVIAGLIAYQGWTSLRAGCRDGDLNCQLAWMREDLSLTDEQFARVVELHARSSSRLRQLALDIGRMETEFAAFEQTRKSEGRVDFLEFARFVAERRELEAAADQSARSLIEATADVMSPTQRLRYLALVAPAAAPPGAGAGADTGRP
ncbi:hypothetical protein [Actomonas aquatica]|uniref:Periplasmic heavy metal sensor n=1 Tax=Actomonas aquatica TaxID=2866162 RepID=A0ABZ1C6J9_9BACT|nr:hypothetical protein [Opitutus sp. WL0086]WRQ87032.1 hypothetical protein K1X11_019635 [Opitutus sp. WL0086]